MKSLSVIIPTVQVKPKILNKLLAVLDKDDVVDEILLINNAQKKFIPIINIKKLKIYNQDKNLYVNPSWNYGIKLIKNDYFLIINDDLLCPENFCSMVMNSDIFDRKDTGLLGLYYWQILNFSPNVDDFDVPNFDENKTIEFIPFNYYMGTSNWGSAFFGKKQNYYDIPDGFKVIFGDNYLLKRNLDAKKKNYFIKNIVCYHTASSSSGSLDINFDNINDFEFAKEYFGEDHLYEIHGKPVS